MSRLTAAAPPGGHRRTSNPGWPRGPPPVGASRRDLPTGCARRSPEWSPGDGGSIPPTSTNLHVVLLDRAHPAFRWQPAGQDPQDPRMRGQRALPVRDESGVVDLPLYRSPSSSPCMSGSTVRIPVARPHLFDGHVEEILAWGAGSHGSRWRARPPCPARSRRRRNTTFLFPSNVWNVTMNRSGSPMPQSNLPASARSGDCPAVPPGTTIGTTLAMATERLDPIMQRTSLEAEAVSELRGIARFKFHEGKAEEFKRLSAQSMEIVRTKDTGTLQYDIYFNDDQSECIVLERYRDSEALIEHVANLGDLIGGNPCNGLRGSRRTPRRAERRAQSEVGRQRGPGSLHALPVDVDTARRLGRCSSARRSRRRRWNAEGLKGQCATTAGGWPGRGSARRARRLHRDVHVARRRHRRHALHEGASGRPLPVPALGLRHQGQDDRSVRRP